MKKYLFLFFIIAILFVLPLASAATVLSVDKVDLISNYEDLDGDIWLIEWIATGETDEIYGQIDADEISDGDYCASHDLKISSEPSINWCEWRIDPEYSWRKVRKLDYNKEIMWPWEIEDWITECQNKAGHKGDVCRPTSLNFQSECICVYYVGDTSTPGTIRDQPDTHYEIEFAVEVEDDTESAVLSSDGGDGTYGSSVKLGDNTWIYWLGNLVSAKTWTNPSPNSEMAMHTSDAWKITDADYYNDFKDYDRSGWWDCFSSWRENWRNVAYLDESGLDECMDTHESYADRALVRKSGGLFVNQGLNVEDEDSMSKSYVKATLDHQFIYPEFRIYVDADWVGINKPVGEPQIVSVSIDKFATNGQLKVSVKNKGDYPGSFELYAQCTGPLDYTDETRHFSLDDGETRNIGLSLTCYTDKDEESGSCTIYFKETTTQEVVSTDTDGICSGITTCIENQEWCDIYNGRDVIYKCSSDGMSSSIKETCSEDEVCEYKNFVPACVEEDNNDDDDDDDGECEWWNLSCHVNNIMDGIKEWAEGILGQFMILQILVSALVFIFGSALTFSWLKKHLDHKGVVIMSTLAVGSILALITYFFLIWGIVVTVIYVIARMLIGYLIPGGKKQ